MWARREARREAQFSAFKARQYREAVTFLRDPQVETPRSLTTTPRSLAYIGSTRTVPVGLIGYDAAGFVSIDCVRRAAQVGDFLSLYMGGLFGTTLDHWKALADAGGAGLPNWERLANQALKGFDDGVASVDSAMRTAEQWGMDPGLIGVVYSGVDFGPTLSQYPVLDQWHLGLVTRHEQLGIRSAGFYGHAGYGDHLISLDWWPADATNWQWAGAGAIRPWTTVKQKYGGYTRDVSGIGCSVDENVVTAAHLTLWTPQGAITPTPPPEDDMALWTAMKVFNGGQELDARFMGIFDDKGGCALAFWDRVGFADRYFAAGWPVRSEDVSGLGNTKLQGRIPFGDRFYDWDANRVFGDYDEQGQSVDVQRLINDAVAAANTEVARRILNG